MVNMGVQYIIALLLSLALGYGIAKSRKGNGSRIDGIAGLAEALYLFCSSLFLTILVCPVVHVF